VELGAQDCEARAASEEEEEFFNHYKNDREPPAGAVPEVPLVCPSSEACLLPLLPVPCTVTGRSCPLLSSSATPGPHLLTTYSDNLHVAVLGPGLCAATAPLCDKVHAGRLAF